MVLVNNTTCVLLVFLCVIWLSTARLNPTGTEVNEISDIKASIATCTTKRTSIASEGNLMKKPSAKQLVRKCGKLKSASSVEVNKSVRSHLSDEVERGLMAVFTADYRRPMHHPPKNN